MNWVAEALSEGNQFNFPLLAAHWEELDEFWDWWWESRDLSVIERPKTINDSDEILTKTIEKDYVDTETYRSFALEINSNWLGINARGHELPRGEMRTKVVDKLTAMIPASDPQQKVVVFLGGGYGAGKTSIGYNIAKTKYGMSPGCSVATDRCKQLIVEYELISAVRDGRASETVQEEAKLMGAMFFNAAVEQGRSFIFDSSLSNAGESKERIIAAKEAGYRIILIAVWVPIGTAIRRAMTRARTAKRFPHPRFLPESHKLFSRNFPELEPYFDETYLLDNTGDGVDPIIIAFRTQFDRPLDVQYPDVYDKFQAQKDP